MSTTGLWVSENLTQHHLIHLCVDTSHYIDHNEFSTKLYVSVVHTVYHYFTDAHRIKLRTRSETHVWCLESSFITLM